MSKTIEEYEAMGVFNEYQMEQIREGLKAGVDVSIYAKPEFHYEQMKQIRDGLESENNDSAEENDEESIPRFPFTRKAEEKEVPEAQRDCSVSNSAKSGDVHKMSMFGNTFVAGGTVPEMKNSIIKLETKVVVTPDDIDAIIAGALDGGSSYWCDGAEVAGDCLGEFKSEQISRGGSLIFHDKEEDVFIFLDKRQLLDGLKMFLENPHPYNILHEVANKLCINMFNVDAIVCDMILQYALFEKRKYA